MRAGTTGLARGESEFDVWREESDVGDEGTADSEGGDED